MRLHRVAMAVFVLASVAACQILIGIDDDDFTVKPGAGTEAEAGIDAADAAPPFVDRCMSARPPQAPAGTTSRLRNTYFIAFDHLDFGGLNDAGLAVGYNLDDVCTCFSGGTTKHDGMRSCASTDDSTFCDENDAGIDNAFSPLYTALIKIDQSGKAKEQQQNGADCGRQTLIAVLRDYNGTANDSDVALGVFISNGIYETLDGSAPGTTDADCTFVGGTAMTIPPKRDGTDVWSYPESAFEPPVNIDNPVPNKLLTGWVTNYQLVIQFGDDKQFLPASVAGTTVTLGSPTITARLVASGAGFAMEDGILGGRVSASEVLAAFGGLSLDDDPDSGAPVHACNHPAFPLLKKATCNAVDILSLPRNDFALPTQKCDAISMMIQFSGSPAHVNGLSTPPTPSTSDCQANFNECPP